MHKQKQAFTIVELVVVVTILAILSTIGFVSYSSYLIGTRDTSRISNMKSVYDGLIMYRSEFSLPLPDDKIEIKSNGTLFSRQGYAGANTLESIDFSSVGKDPKDDTYYSYYLTRDRSSLQLMGFLEEASNSPEKPILSTNEERYPIVYGDKLGILTGTGTNINVPIQAISAIKTAGELDVITTTTPYNAHMRDNEIASGTGDVLFKMTEIALIGGHFCGASNDTLYCAQTPLFPKNLIGYWDFESGYTDKSNTANVAEAGGSIISNELENSTRNNYASFDGVDDCIEVPDHSKYQLVNGTVSLWTKVNDTSVEGGLFSRDAAGSATYPGHFTMRSNTGSTVFWSRIQTVPSSSYIYTSIPVTKSDWNHITTTFGSNGFKSYINGVLDADTSSVTRGWIGNDNPIGIGCNNYTSSDGSMIGSSEFLDGYIDNVSIYDRELTASEALELYNYQK